MKLPSMWRDALFDRLFTAISAPSPLLFSILACEQGDAEKGGIDCIADAQVSISGGIFRFVTAAICDHAISRASRRR
jgi:hypothetical protein